MTGGLEIESKIIRGIIVVDQNKWPLSGGWNLYSSVEVRNNHISDMYRIVGHQFLWLPENACLCNWQEAQSLGRAWYPW
jgi:hypothetical protein